MKLLINMIIITCLLFPYEILLAQTNKEFESNVYSQAKHDAEIDADFYTNDFQWLACGFLGSFIGVGAAYLMKSNPPQERLIGKPSGYVTIYTMIYNRESRLIRLKHSLIGCAISSTIAGCIGTALIYKECVESDPFSPCFSF